MIVTRLRNIFLGIFAVFLAIFIISLFFKSSYGVRRDVLIAASPSEVFKYVNSPREWDKWIITDTSDTNYRYSYAGPPSGRSSRKSLKGPLVDIEFRIRESHVDTSVRYSVSTNDGEFNTEAHFLLFPDKEGTRLVWVDSGNVGYNTFARFSLKGMGERQGADMEKHLQCLKKLVENN